MRASTLVAAASAAAVAAIIACGGGSNSSNPGTPTTGSGSNTCTAASTSTTITISNNSVCPQNITVPLGTQVTFVNNDTVAHEMNSDPHPEHTDCPEINSVGHLEPGGQTRRTDNLNRVRRCGFHDHLREQVQSLRGSITIQ